MSKLQTFKQSIKASTKSQRWSRKERFAMGHDRTCRALIPDVFIDRPVERRPLIRKMPIQSVHSKFFEMSTEERLTADATYFLNTGRAENVDKAVQMAIDNRNHQL